MSNESEEKEIEIKPIKGKSGIEYILMPYTVSMAESISEMPDDMRKVALSDIEYARADCLDSAWERKKREKDIPLIIV